MIRLKFFYIYFLKNYVIETLKIIRMQSLLYSLITILNNFFLMKENIFEQLYVRIFISELNFYNNLYLYYNIYILQRERILDIIPILEREEIFIKEIILTI